MTAFTDEDLETFKHVKRETAEFFNNIFDAKLRFLLNYDFVVVGSFINFLLDPDTAAVIIDDFFAEEGRVDIFVDAATITKLMTLPYIQLKALPLSLSRINSSVVSYELIDQTDSPDQFPILLHRFPRSQPKEKIIGIIPFLHAKPHVIYKTDQEFSLYISEQQMDCIQKKHLVHTTHGIKMASPEKVNVEDRKIYNLMVQKYERRGYFFPRETEQDKYKGE